MAKSRTISIQSVSCEDSATDTAEDSSEDSAEPDVSLSCDTTEGNDGCQKSPE